MFEHPVYEGAVFSINFIHSVNQSPVSEVFEIRHGGIMLTALEFEDFGAGMPVEAEPGQQLIRTENGLRLENINREVYRLNYMVGHGVCISLHIGELRVKLRELAQPGALVTIKVE